MNPACTRSCRRWRPSNHCGVNPEYHRKHRDRLARDALPQGERFASQYELWHGGRGETSRTAARAGDGWPSALPFSHFWGEAGQHRLGVRCISCRHRKPRAWPGESGSARATQRIFNTGADETLNEGHTGIRLFL